MDVRFLISASLRGEYTGGGSQGLCCFPSSVETSAVDEATGLCHMDEYQLLPDEEKLLLDIISFYYYCDVRSYFGGFCVYFNTQTGREKRKCHKYQHFSPCEVP